MRLRFPWFSFGLAVALAGIIHIGAVLVLPKLASRNAWSRLGDYGKVNQLAVLPAASPDRAVMPMMTPDMRIAVCRYNLTKGPIALNTRVLDPDWMLTFNAAGGGNYYTVRGGDIKQPEITVIIARPDDLILDAGPDRPQNRDDIIVVRAPRPRGFATISAPLPSRAHAARTEAALAASDCGPYAAPTRGAPPLPLRRPDA